MTAIEKLRNIGIIAHIDAGKTTTTELILHYSGQEHTVGRVDDGTTTTDWMQEERERGITIVSAAVSCTWHEHRITIIDTPGHIDFTAEVERSLRVVDGAVGIFCAVGGVEAQSETVWKQADRYNVPRIAYINKLDRVGANFESVVNAIRHRLGANPVVITMPWGEESEFRGVIDVVSMKALTFEYDTDLKQQGRKVISHDIPPELLPKAEFYRGKLIDALADCDDEIIVKFSDGTLQNADIVSALRKATLQNKLTPVLSGASLRYKGVPCLLDAIVDYLPSPADVPPVEGVNPKTEKPTTRRIDDKDLCALAFKTVYTKHGDIIYVRVYSGILQEPMQVYNPGKDKVERVNRLWYIYANQLLKCDSAGPGEIVGIVGFRHTATGDTLCKKNRPVILERMKFPETVISKAIEPKTIADKDRLFETLQILSRDDPTFSYTVDEETGQTLICGMGELHLDIIHSRIRNEHRMEVNLGKPRVSYRETIAGKAEGECRYHKQFAGKEHFAYLRVCVEPWKDGSFSMVNKLKEDEIPKHFHAAVEEGVRSAASGGELAGYPLLNIKVTVLAGEFDDGTSSEIAFNKAAYEATKAAMQKAGYVLLEPIMRLQVQIPINYLGDVIGNLGARRADIEEIKNQGELQTITGRVPLAEMFGYANELRTISQGRGTYTMEPLQYAIVPEDVQNKLIEFRD